jgi:2,4-diketo-3-deoxy-L-fuconate hydrolase
MPFRGGLMKLIRVGAAGSERPALIDASGMLRDLTGAVADIAGVTLTREGLNQLRALDATRLPLLPSGARIGPAVGAVGKVICVGLNFRDHAVESQLQVPDQPILFMKATTALCGPYDDVVIPHGSTKTDWEVELGVVIGDVARRVPVSRALEHVAGYIIVNDISERAFQLERGGQWVKGKSCDTFGPIGPLLVTTDEIPDPQKLSMWLEVNGRRYQDGLGQRPPAYLKPEDLMELGIEGLGRQRQKVVAAE